VIGRDYDLQRFVSAQEGTFERALRELRNGRKTTHWMWYIFPQIAGLGHSATARCYALAGAAEARAYLAHPLLGPRLLECTDAVNALAPTTASAIFGYPDDLKFRSCMTLFEQVSAKSSTFAEALRRLCDDQRDDRTLSLLRATGQ
jgi:uncharacterized protein (DUF1810 family)